MAYTTRILHELYTSRGYYHSILPHEVARVRESIPFSKTISMWTRISLLSVATWELISTWFVTSTRTFTPRYSMPLTKVWVSKGRSRNYWHSTACYWPTHDGNNDRYHHYWPQSLWGSKWYSNNEASRTAGDSLPYGVTKTLTLVHIFLLYVILSLKNGLVVSFSRLVHPGCKRRWALCKL